jgi:hypothetical protein
MFRRSIEAYVESKKSGGYPSTPTTLARLTLVRQSFLVQNYILNKCLKFAVVKICWRTRKILTFSYVNGLQFRIS